MRTALGGFQGAMASLTATQLGAQAVKAAVDQAGIAPELNTQGYSSISTK